MNFLSCLIVEAAFALSSTLVLSQTLGFPAFTFPIPSPGQLCGKWAGAAVRCSTASLLVINHNTGKKYWELKIFFLSSLNTHLRPCLTLETCKELPKGHIGRTHSILLVLYVAEVAGRYWAKWSLIGQKMPWKHNFYKHYQNNILIKKKFIHNTKKIIFSFHTPIVCLIPIPGANNPHFVHHCIPMLTVTHLISIFLLARDNKRRQTIKKKCSSKWIPAGIDHARWKHWIASVLHK